MPEKPTMVVTRGTLWGSVIVVLVAVVCARLGWWQLQRLEQRRARNHATLERMRLAPAQFSPIGDDTTGLIFRRTVLNGSFDDERTIIIAGRSLRGVPGVHVLTPLRLGGAAVLVNRGWMPSADGARIELDSIRESSPRNLAALITPFPEDYGRTGASDGFQQVWFQMNGARLRAQFPYHVFPALVQILPHSGQPQFPIRLRPPELDEGPHLGYAIQWFSFAAIALIGWSVLLLRRRRESELHPSEAFDQRTE
jgi:surfeit locus 1 family protein